MLTITVDARDEIWDPSIGEFVSSPSGTLILEHSLLSVSKWESKYHKSFMKSVKNKDVSGEEIRYYIQCMTVNNVNKDVYNGLTPEDLDKIFAYIADPMTATVINSANKNGGQAARSSEVITAELIYYWMVAHQIPFECQKWHLNRLLTLIEVCNVKNAPAKKMSKRDILKQNRSINAARRAKSKAHH